MLGEAVYEHFKGICKLFPTDIDINEPWLGYLDVTDYARVREKIQQIKPDYIIHLAALIDMEYCERNPVEAYKVNTLGTEQIALLCNEFQIPLVYISTAGVFDDSKERYVEYDTPNPVHVYGKSVYAAERFIQENLKHYFILRSGWLIGGGPKKDKKFVKTVVNAILAGDSEIRVGEGRYSTPTYTPDLARTIQVVLEQGNPGIYHAVCEGGASRADIAKQIVALLHLQDSVQVIKEERAFFKPTYFAPRPASSGLLNMKLKLQNLPVPREWRSCLAEYFQKYPWQALVAAQRKMPTQA